jgi:hypothetical protein
MKNHKATASLVGIFVGIIIIIIGLCVQGISISAYHTDIGKDIKFGADFYTEIYAVTQDVGAAINSLKYTVATAVESVCDAIGWLIVSLGAIDVCFFAYKYIVEITQAIKNQDAKLNNIDKNLQSLAESVINDSKKNAKREAEEQEKCMAEEQAKCEAENKEFVRPRYICKKCGKIREHLPCEHCGSM